MWAGGIRAGCCCTLTSWHLGSTAGWATTAWMFGWHQIHLHQQQAKPKHTQPEQHYVVPCCEPEGRTPQPLLTLHQLRTILGKILMWVRPKGQLCLNRAPQGREGRVVVSTRCTRQLFLAFTSSDPVTRHKVLCFTSVFFWEWHDTRQSPMVLQGHTHTNTHTHTQKSNSLLVSPSHYSRTLTTDCSFVDTWLLPVLTCAIAFWSPTRQSTVWKDVHMKARVNSKTSVPGCKGAEFNISKTYRKGQCIMEVEGDEGGVCRGRG